MYHLEHIRTDSQPSDHTCGMFHGSKCSCSLCTRIIAGYGYKCLPVFRGLWIRIFNLHFLMTINVGFFFSPSNMLKY